MFAMSTAHPRINSDPASCSGRALAEDEAAKHERADRGQKEQDRSGLAIELRGCVGDKQPADDLTADGRQR